MSYAYLNLAARAPRRLAILRAYVEKHNAAYGGNKPGNKVDWRTARYATFASDTGLSAGFNGEGRARVPVWYTQDGAPFPRERFADECSEAPRHVRDVRGYFTDCDGSETARGIVARLSHGRFLAGYHWNSNGERVYFGEVFTEEREAARRADSHAERFAETAREDSERFSAARALEYEIEEKETRLRECLALRNNARFNGARGEARDTLESIRLARETLANDYAEYI
jgi:hypothetical protein